MSFLVMMPLLRPKALGTLALAALSLASAHATTISESALVTARMMGKAQLQAHLEFIASDEMQGRDTPSPGLEISALYIASHLKQWGVAPGGDKGTYFQHFEVPDRQGGRALVKNVIGIIPGRDAQLAPEHVVIGAHYDHIGVAQEGTDKIYNGADDNGSGTVALLEMARVLAQGHKPKRSILLIWFAGEERGLWGSAHFVQNPTVPIESQIAMFNMDMIGRSWSPDMGEGRKELVSQTGEIFVIGSKMMSDGFGQIIADVNQGFHGLSYNFKFDDPNDRNRLFYRSDHIQFARKGIPSVFFFDGLHTDYHQVWDEVERIDYDKMLKVSQTVLATAWQVAEAPQRPKVDRPLPAQARRGGSAVRN